MFKVHGFLDDKMVIRNRMEHLPRVGDTLRFADEQYATVTEVIWCMDEPAHEGQRINLRIESLPPAPTEEHQPNHRRTHDDLSHPNRKVR